jgi:hypothetical protein
VPGGESLLASVFDPGGCIPSRSKLWWDQNINPKFSLPLLTRIPGVFVLHGSDWFVNYMW